MVEHQFAITGENWIRGSHRGTVTNSTRTEWSWIFEKGDRPTLIISTLDPLEALLQS